MDTDKIFTPTLPDHNYVWKPSPVKTAQVPCNEDDLNQSFHSEYQPDDDDSETESESSGDSDEESTDDDQKYIVFSNKLRELFRDVSMC